jgi:hypothetical protein
MTSEAPPTDELTSALLTLLSGLFEYLNWEGGAGIGAVLNGFDPEKAEPHLVRQGNQVSCPVFMRKKADRGFWIELSFVVTIEDAKLPGLPYKTYQLRFATVEHLAVVSPDPEADSWYHTKGFNRGAAERIRAYWARM